MRIKCTCKDACVAGSCPCYMNDFECDASLCHCKDCGNMEVQCGRQPKLKVGDSGIAGGGLGAYACEDIEKGRLVAVYIGEIIDYQTELLRQVNLRDSSMYNFALKEKAIDARYIGNKARFVNHDNGKLENCRAKVYYLVDSGEICGCRLFPVL
jgi:SET domain-containing protein